MCNDSCKTTKALGTVYGIGIGPGDPELLTVKALRILKEVDYVFAPRASIKTSSLAADIIKESVPEEKIITVIFSMTKDPSVLETCWREAAVQVHEKVLAGKNVAFITIGDPGIYSTYTYLVRYLRENDTDVPIVTVPGISIINATAASFSRTIVEGDERFAVMPLPQNLDDIKKYTVLFDTIVLLKINKRLAVLVDFLEKEGLAESACFVHRLGHGDEYAADKLTNLKGLAEKIGYLSTMIVRVSHERTM